MVHKLSPKAGYNPKTAAKSEMKLKAAPGNPGNNRSQQAEAQIKEPPAPFNNPQGALKATPTKKERGTGNTAGNKKRSAFYGA